MKSTRNQLLEELSNKGYVFSSFSLQTIGNYSPEDAIWNYIDAISHIPYIHKLVQNIPAVIEDQNLCSIFIQKIFGFKFPIVVVDYQLDPYSQTTFTTYLCFILIVHNQAQAIEGGQGRVTTTYSIGSPKYLRWAFPAIKWILTKNYYNLMDTDVPLRERRAELRKWGYLFRKTTYKSATQIGMDNLIVPDFPPLPKITLSFSQLEMNKPYLVGRTDHLGLKLVRRENRLYFYPRLCPHEGAVLDTTQCNTNSKLKCPWHGRLISPLAHIDLTTQSERTLELPYHSLKIQADGLVIKSKNKIVLSKRAPKQETTQQPLLI